MIGNRNGAADDSTLFFDSSSNEDEDDVNNCLTRRINTSRSSAESRRGGLTRRGTTRPVSYLLAQRNDSPDRIRGESKSNGCQTCWGGAHCWCPNGSRTRTTPPGNTEHPWQRRDRSTEGNLRRCDTCDKVYLPANGFRCCSSSSLESSECSSLSRFRT